MSLERYRRVVPEWSELLGVVGSPEPTTIRVSRAEIEGRRAVERLRAQGFGLRGVDGMPGFYRVSGGPSPVSKTLEHWLGDFYVQQAVTGVAVPALGPRRGERVLDLCAAPGGKSVHLSELVGGGGTVVASEVDGKRIRALLANVFRLRRTNVLVTEGDGRSFPTGAAFDRVLVDVPCSGEGNLRERGGRLPPRDASFSDKVSGVQRALLRRALELVRPGGVVLYVTCTFAPEENEAVVDDVLRSTDSPAASLEPIDLDLPHSPGLTRFEGRKFDEDLSLAWRIYPHHLNSGGLFLARIRRAGSGDVPDAYGAGWTPVPERFPDATGRGEGAGGDSAVPGAAADARSGGARRDRARARIESGLEGLEERFGVAFSERGRSDEAETRAPGWMVRGDSVWIHDCDVWPVDAWHPEDRPRLLSLGLRALKKDPRTTYGERPTSHFLRACEDEIGRGQVEVDEEAALELLDRRSVPCRGLSRGFAAWKLRGRVLGRGWVGDGVLSNEIPKPRAESLARDLRSRGRRGSGEGRRS